MRKWAYETLPIIPEKWKYEVKTETKSQYNILKKLMNDNRISTIICATEDGREEESLHSLIWTETGSVFFRRAEFIAL